MSRRDQRRVHDPDWFAIVKEGDVLRSPSGALRVVRRVTRRGDYDLNRRPGRSRGVGLLVAVCFVKRRCSRYESPTTSYWFGELRTWKYVGARVKLDLPFDEEIERSFDNLGERCLLHQCDVVGVLP